MGTFIFPLGAAWLPRGRAERAQSGPGGAPERPKGAQGEPRGTPGGGPGGPRWVLGNTLGIHWVALFSLWGPCGTPWKYFWEFLRAAGQLWVSFAVFFSFSMPCLKIRGSSALTATHRNALPENSSELRPYGHVQERPARKFVLAHPCSH